MKLALIAATVALLFSLFTVADIAIHCDLLKIEPGRSYVLSQSVKLFAAEEAYRISDDYILYCDWK